MNILDELRWRGLLADCTDLEALGRRLDEGPITLYCGFDPTADSLHVGNLVPLLALRRFQQAGHHVIALAGGATGMVGDPSGKSAERNLQTPEQVEHNIASIRRQLSQFLDFDVAANPARLVNNHDWTAPVSVLEFLRDIGKHITVNSMVAKDSVRSRMEDRESGISYTEFSYMLLQGFDFYHLRKTFQCELQIGATDQWGNITVGTELTRKKLGATVWGLVFPLLTKADGTKYGKTATGTVWLDPRRTSPYRFYQFWLTVDDRDVVRYLKFFTWLPRETIDALAETTERQPGAREAQRVLAREVTRLVHGDEELQRAERASAVLFGGSLRSASVDDLLLVFDDVPSTEVSKAVLQTMTVAAALVYSGNCASKGDAVRLVRQGGVSINGERETDERRLLTEDDLLGGRLVVLQKGARDRRLLRVVEA